ncbi:MAG TPA: cytochrome c oxidase subunit II [Gammaproteobacteria bacterium]|jgi:cytochrome c oxidase subunit 2
MTRLLCLRGVALVVAACALGAPALADLDLNMPQGVTTGGREIYGLHMLILWVCVLIASGVYLAMIVAIVRFRKAAGAIPAKFTHNTTAEVIWTVIPAVILIALAVPAARTLVRLEDTRDSDLTIRITGYQWQWHYEYIDAGVSFYSRLAPQSNAARQPGSGIDPFSVENYLLDVTEDVVVPVGAKVRLLIGAADVLHAWWVPDLGVKKDAIPGFINESWFEAVEEGTFRGQCAELCGMDHGFMPIVVRVVSQDAYQSWLTEKLGAQPTAGER